VCQLYGPAFFLNLFTQLPKSSLPTELRELAHTAYKFGMKMGLGELT
jgi:hypothetical protein